MGSLALTDSANGFTFIPPMQENWKKEIEDCLEKLRANGFGARAQEDEGLVQQREEELKYVMCVCVDESVHKQSNKSLLQTSSLSFLCPFIPSPTSFPCLPSGMLRM